MLENNMFSINQELPYTAPKYAIFIQDVLRMYKKNPNSAIRKVNNSCKNKEGFLKLISSFENKYENASDYLIILYRIADTMKDDCSKKKKSNSYINKEAFHKKFDYSDLFNRIYESGLSILDYLFYNYEANFQFNPCSKKISIPKKYKEIMNRPNNTLPLIFDIINKIKEGKIDYIDYYELTKLHPKFLKHIAIKNGIECGLLTKFVDSFNYSMSIVPENEIQTNLVIDSKEVSMEIKQEAIKYIKNIDAPLNEINYRTMVKKLMRKR